MTSWTFVKRSLRFYWRTHIGVVLGAAVSTAILVGALVIGDSVRYSLKMLAMSRLGEVKFALVPQNRYFRAELADELKTTLDTKTAPVLMLQGIVSNSDGTARVNRVQVLGVDERFWALDSSKPMFDSSLSDKVLLNERLSSRLDVSEGEEVLLRVEKPGLLPRDAPLSTDADSSIAMRLNVSSIISDSNFGRFSLQANQVTPFNAFVSLAWLQEKIDLNARANMLLVGNSSDDGLTLTESNAALRENWKLIDANLELECINRVNASLEQNMLELRTDRVFLEPPVVGAAQRAMPESVGILTYFVNGLRLGNHTTPYSMVTAIDKSLHLNLSASLHNMNDDEIIINTWLAEDLNAEAGDVIELTYFVVGNMRKLEERSSSFRVKDIVPIEGIAADKNLMPEFPGISDVENCVDWEPGIPIDLDKIREKDEKYWDLYRGTPKAFVTLKAGQRMWGNRFGNLTAIRYPSNRDRSQFTDSRIPSGDNDQMKVKETRNTKHTTRNTPVEKAIKGKLDPALLGLFFQPVRKQAFEASTQALDFGQLFLGLSFFLIVAALLLMSLLFVFGIEQRTEEVGTLLALGFQPYRIRRLFLLEGSVLALSGGILGAFGGIWYTKVMLYALSTVWKGAVGGTSALQYYAQSSTLILGTLAGIVIALLAIWLTLRRQAKSSTSELLTGDVSESNLLIPSLAKSKLGLWIAIGTVTGALIVLILAGKGKDKDATTAFFISGGLLLLGGLGFSQALLSSLARSVRKMKMKLANLGLRNSVRRIGRSLAIVGLLACGSFLIIAVGANRKNPYEKAQQRSSGTGGFALYAESTMPVFHDLNSKKGLGNYGLNTDRFENVKFVQLRIHEGDDASCLNLNRAQKPRLMGIEPEELEKRNAFTFVETIESLSEDEDNSWRLLEYKEDDNIVPAVGDEATIIWALGKSVGDTLPYRDERGNAFRIKIVGMLTNSVLQGGLLISEDKFIERFPSESGYRTFLIDVQSENVEEISNALSYALQDKGLEVMSTTQRLAEFNTVQNTYLSIFQILGGLALILGSIGLGIVVFRNVMERRSELALMRAVGFENSSLKWLILSEHWLLLLMGLLCGVVAGFVAVLPALRSPGTNIPYLSLILTLLAIVFSGTLWIWLATLLALRGPLLSSLRNE